MTAKTEYVRIGAENLAPGDVIRAYAPNCVSGESRIDSRGVVHVELQSPKGYVVASIRYYRHDSIVIVRRTES